MRLAVLLLVLSISTQARAESDDASLVGGSTIARGDVILSAGLGWPGFFGEARVGVRPGFDIGARGSVFYGTPIAGFDTSTGGAVSLPMRIALKRATWSVLLEIHPFAMLGEATLFGASPRHGESFGYAIGSELVLRVSRRFRATTLAFGVGGSFSNSRVRDADLSDLAGTTFLLVAAEARMTDTLRLFIEIAGGYAFVPDERYTSPVSLRAALGVAYLL